MAARLPEFGRAAGVVSLVLVIGSGIKYVQQVLLANWLGPGGFGTLSFVLATAQLLAIGSSFGFDTVVLRYVPRYLVRDEHEFVRGIIRRGRGLAVLGGSLVGLLSILFFTYTQPGDIELSVVVLGGILVPPLALLELHTQVIRSFGRAAIALLTRDVVYPTLALLLAATFLLGKKPSNTPFAVLAFALALVIVSFLQYGYIKRIWPRQARESDARSRMDEWLRVAVPMLLVAIATRIIMSGGIVLLGFIRPQSEVGLYTAATRTAGLVGYPLLALNMIGAPKISELFSKGEYELLGTYVRSLSRWALAGSLAIAIPLLLFPSEMLRLFGGEFAGAGSALSILVIGNLINVSFGPIGLLLLLTKHEKDALLVTGVVALSGIAAHLSVIPALGYVGAAIVSASMLGLWNVGQFLVAIRRMGISSFILGSATNA